MSNFENSEYLTGWNDAVERMRGKRSMQVNIAPNTPTHNWRTHKTTLCNRMARAKRVAYARSKINTPVYNTDII